MPSQVDQAASLLPVVSGHSKPVKWETYWRNSTAHVTPCGSAILRFPVWLASVSWAAMRCTYARGGLMAVTGMIARMTVRPTVESTSILPPTRLARSRISDNPRPF